jgi:hypothetical protein
MLFFLTAKKENVVFLKQAGYKKLYKESRGGQEVELFHLVKRRQLRLEEISS